jgi:hypothetical protein
MSALSEMKLRAASALPWMKLRAWLAAPDTNDLALLATPLMKPRAALAAPEMNDLALLARPLMNCRAWLALSAMNEWAFLARPCTKARASLALPLTHARAASALPLIQARARSPRPASHSTAALSFCCSVFQSWVALFLRMSQPRLAASHAWLASCAAFWASSLAFVLMASHSGVTHWVNCCHLASSALRIGSIFCMKAAQACSPAFCTALKP